jgi:acetyltransferase-like isoleucine patch superfamily enzyme
MSSSGFDHTKSSFKVSSQEDVEKSKMLRSVPYSALDPTLHYERQRCNRALKRYNAAWELDSGLGDQERRNLLLKVIDPSQDTTHRSPSQNHSKGYIGPSVWIEAPFTCTYGYNLKILDDVCIGPGCTLDDCGTIEIGSRTWIGSGVRILTTDTGRDLVHRKGTKAQWIANDVFIGTNVVIGAGAIIYPGVTIEDHATVEPGAVVTQSLKTGQTQRASPGRIDDATPYAREVQ